MRFSSRFRFLGLPVLLFAVPACFTWDGCDIDLGECQTDDDCAADEFCDAGAFFGPACVHANLCSTDGDCGFGFHCLLRRDDPAEHPFDAPTPRPGICDCSPDCPSPSGTTSSTTTTGTTSTTAQGGGGAATTAGAGGAGGAGGAQ